MKSFPLQLEKRVECFVASLSRVPPDESSNCDGGSVIQEAIEHAVFVKLDLYLGKEEPPLKPMRQAASGLMVVEWRDRFEKGFSGCGNVTAFNVS
jgi:hypothetical protein